MIETMDDIISLGFIIVIVIILLWVMYRVFLAHHLLKIDKMEADYYEEGDEDAYMQREE